MQAWVQLVLNYVTKYHKYLILKEFAGFLIHPVLLFVLEALM